MIFVLAYCLFAALLGYYNFRLIESGKRIYHALNGLLHLSAAGLITYYFSWQLGLSLLLLVRVVFDTTLNIFRSLGVGYISDDPHSIIDKIEGKFIELIATWIYWKRKYVSESDIERVAILFRVVVLITGVTLLFI